MSGSTAGLTSGSGGWGGGMVVPGPSKSTGTAGPSSAHAAAGRPITAVAPRQMARGARTARARRERRAARPVEVTVVERVVVMSSSPRVVGGHWGEQRNDGASRFRADFRDRAGPAASAMSPPGSRGRRSPSRPPAPDRARRRDRPGRTSCRRPTRPWCRWCCVRRGPVTVRDRVRVDSSDAATDTVVARGAHPPTRTAGSANETPSITGARSTFAITSMTASPRSLLTTSDAWTGPSGAAARSTATTSSACSPGSSVPPPPADTGPSGSATNHDKGEPPALLIATATEAAVAPRSTDPTSTTSRPGSGVVASEAPSLGSSPLWSSWWRGPSAHYWRARRSPGSQQSTTPGADRHLCRPARLPPPRDRPRRPAPRAPAATRTPTAINRRGHQPNSPATTEALLAPVPGCARGNPSAVHGEPAPQARPPPRPGPAPAARQQARAKRRRHGQQAGQVRRGPGRDRRPSSPRRGGRPACG